MNLIEKYLGEKTKKVDPKYKHHYTVYKKGLSGKLSNKEHLNADEFDKWMLSNKFANIRVERSDGKWIEYTDTGLKGSRKWEIVKKGKK